MKPRIPSSTYRLQFNARFTFRAAARILPYLHELGISDIYASPYFKAKQGSLHGYDIVDHHALNPEVGSEEEHASLVAGLQRLGMGQVLDIVPNHMCIEGPGNRWWLDVLENGPSSPNAAYFDIEWAPVKKELREKVLIPVLGDQYGAVLEGQELGLVFREGSFFVRYYDHVFPLRPQTYALILEHRLPALGDAIPPDSAEYAEYLSIITALKHLPSYTETDPARIEERYREKEVVKRRLWTLCMAFSRIRVHIEENTRLFNGTKGDPASFDLLDSLLGQQVYRLAFWRVAAEEINYRRFFDINGLGAIRVERPEVFRATHERILEMVRRGSVTGLRVDHPDGLFDPVQYFRRLQKECFLAQPGAPGSGADLERQYEETVLADPAYKPFYIVGEKILTKSERMPEDWPIFSTTGYVFLNSVNGIFIDGDQAKAFDRTYEKFTGSRVNVQDIIHAKKKLVMQVSMSSEVNTLGHYLNDLSERNRNTRDFTLYSLRSAIIEVIAAFPVYRTYTNSLTVSERDSQVVEQAVHRAKRKNPAISESIFDFLKDVLLLRFPKGLADGDRRDWLDFVMRFQQISGPVMAKGAEDTAFYVYNRLVSLNEVGGMPERFGTPLETFHGQNIERMKSWPHALIATATHDTKRSEDVRARINVLSEFPGEWSDRVRAWARMNRKKKGLVDGREAPDRNEEYLLYQSLIGAWPLDDPDDPGENAYDVFVQRIREYMIKASREAKVNTSWVNPDGEYEQALLAFIDALLAQPRQNQFLNDFLPFQRMVSHYGLFNSLSQTLLKICAPGVPDFYQGTELWDFSLVDPDNRRPVNFEKRISMLADLKESGRKLTGVELARDLSLKKEDGRIKLHLVSRALHCRRSNRRLFDEGAYVPLDAGGARAAHLCAFARQLGDASVLVAVPRFLTRLIAGPGALPFGRSVWEDTFVPVPGPPGELRNLFSGETLRTENSGGGVLVRAGDLFSAFPVALLERTG